MSNPKTSQFNRRGFLRAAGGAIGLANLSFQGGSRPAEEPKQPVSCSVYPAVPDRLSALLGQGCRVKQKDSLLLLENDYLGVEISRRSGLITAVVNKVVDRRYPIIGDEAGFQVRPPGGSLYEWQTTAATSYEWEVTVAQTPELAHAALRVKTDAGEVELLYRIRRDQFWIERSYSVLKETQPTEFERIVYGNLDIPEAQVRILELGKFDRPRLVLVGEQGGVFAGVGWWFYQVDETGTYLNEQMSYRCDSRFESEPYYLGVFAAEQGEPYPGWLWYRTYLQQRKMADDRQPAWSYWNAGWGQWGIDIDDTSAPEYLELIHRLGIRGIAFGSGGGGKGLPAYVRLALTQDTARNNLALLGKYDLVGGFLDSGGLGEEWADEDVVSAKLELLKEYEKLGFGALYFDFFKTTDTYTAHRNVTEYFRASREKMDYTECHLGMAAYGPQFQRQVLLNHPTDLHGFDLSHFSSDWTTFLGFRQSRREWQERYDYLMPEYGLYYFITHYSNWGHPRRYRDPEPQQFLYRPHAYCGIAYNFHDRIGFRSALAAAAAFTPFYVFGHLDLRMPTEDIDFTRAYLRWISENVDLLSQARVCLESEDACVVSKIQNGKGAIFLLNYVADQQTFKLRVRTGSAGSLKIQRVYPRRKPAFSVREGEDIEVTVGGENVAIFDVNQGLRTLPPENDSLFSLQLRNWKQNGNMYYTSFPLPDIRGLLAASRESNLPRELVSLDQMGEAAPGILDPQLQKDVETVQWIGRGELPDRFLEVYRFRGRTAADTWKFAPWAFADRVWLVYRPTVAPDYNQELPWCRVNGKPVDLVPRVDYRPAEPQDWTCPILFADITDVCRYGRTNEVSLSGPEQRGFCYVVCGASRSSSTTMEQD